MATVKDFVRNGLPPQTHAYNDPDLSPIEFLQAVYHATHLPMSIRIDAARGLLPYTEPRPATVPSPSCTIVIPPLASPWPRLRPDLAHLPIPEPRLCSCGHWMFGPCPLGERCRDKSKLN
jgi:hypothetical protein